MKLKGKYRIVVKDKRVRYELNIERKYSIIRGNSATGKSTLADMIDVYNASIRKGEKPYIYVESKVKIERLKYRDYVSVLKNTSGIIYIIDENDECFSDTKEMCKSMLESDNYFIIITRRKLEMLPYSIKSIFEMKEDKYNGASQTYCCNVLSNMYEEYSNNVVPDSVIVEDSGSGFDMYKHIFKNCRTSFGNGNIITELEQDIDNKDVLSTMVIVDGAAFGPYIEKFDAICKIVKDMNIILEAPESFEYLILKAVYLSEVEDEVRKTYNYCDAKEFNSWEQFYTALLITVANKSKETWYSKSKLNRYYLMYKDKIRRICKY